MTRSGPDGTTHPARRAWSLGVRARLLLAFIGITAFAVLAAGAGMYAFREVGGRLDVIDARVPPALSALELSRSAERIIAAAPALLSAPDRDRRDEITAELAAEAKRLNARLAELKDDDDARLPLLEIEPLVASLTGNLSTLEELVARRLETSERIRGLRRGAFRARDEAQRLLAPWLEITGSQIAALAETNEAGGGTPGRLARLIALQRQMRTAQARVSAVADILAEASTTEEAERLPVFAFQLGLALRDLEAVADGLDPRLRALLLERVAELRGFAEGPDAIAEAREQELALIAQGEALLADTTGLSAQLTAAVDRLGSAAKRDIGAAIGDALSVQRLSARALVAVVALSLLTSVLIVWLYVGRSIVRRLTALGDSMLAIAGGRLRTPVVADGTDEIAAMGRAVEIFRRNAIDLERLLEERAQTAARLEQEVEARTRDLSDKSRQLEIANRFKSHFLASASHDLRQPLHALNLFVAQLRNQTDAAGRERLAGRIDSAVSSMNALFEQLLDMSKLEAGIIEPQIAEFPIERTLRQIETTFAEAARRKGLRLCVVPSAAWARSDPVLFERMLMNLVSNAVRYTAQGGVVVGCRRRGGRLRIDVCDSGPGIPPEQQQTIFGEYYRLGASKPASEPECDDGIGLGLAIVERLGRLMNHEIELVSRPGRGSRFSVWLPLAMERRGAVEASPPVIADPAHGKLVVVIDDDPLVLEGMGSILHGWGCDLVATASADAALSRLTVQERRPDLIISDYRLASGETGIEAIARLRHAFGAGVPAFLISGDTAPERLSEARAHGIHLLHKPVAPMRLRAMLHRFLTPRLETQATAPAAE